MTNAIPDDRGDDRKLQAQTCFQAGQRAFEFGNYPIAIQKFEQGRTFASASSALHGELQTWLVTAYEAAGDRDRALELCRTIGSHPNLETRKQAKRLLYILEAPKLRRKEDWLTKIPDLTDIRDNNDKNWGTTASNLTSPKPVKIKPPEGYVIPEPTDPTKVNMGDERSLGWAVAGAIAILLGVLWFGIVA